VQKLIYKSYHINVAKQYEPIEKKEVLLAGTKSAIFTRMKLRMSILICLVVFLNGCTWLHNPHHLTNSNGTVLPTTNLEQIAAN